ncbi:MAG: hypothetical protein AMJ46_03590 [Latescibacteria bacterium DG_63]|nr:MAG: hypothetical protein AMJ46_03590 [Latescibacteria bacterium DG_63]
MLLRQSAPSRADSEADTDRCEVISQIPNSRLAQLFTIAYHSADREETATGTGCGPESTRARVPRFLMDPAMPTRRARTYFRQAILWMKKRQQIRR